MGRFQAQEMREAMKQGYIITFHDNTNGNYGLEKFELGFMMTHPPPFSDVPHLT